MSGKPMPYQNLQDQNERALLQILVDKTCCLEDAVKQYSQQNYFDEVAMGNVQDASIWNKFGYNTDVDIAAPEIIAAFGGAFSPATGIMTNPQTFTITYNAATDGAGTLGARVLYIYYLRWDNQLDIITHELGNTGTDVTTATGLGINRAIVVSNGGTPYAVNNITITATTDATTQALIPAGGAVTQQMIFHTPIGYNFLLHEIELYVLKVTAGTEPVVTIQGFSWSRVTRTRYEFKRVRLDTAIENEFSRSYNTPIVFGGREVIYFMCTTDKDDTSASGSFGGILRKVGT